MLEITAHVVLTCRNILADTHSSPLFAVMVDETTGKSNNEQLMLLLQWNTKDFVVLEELLASKVCLNWMHRALSI